MTTDRKTLSFESLLGSREAAPDAVELRERICEHFRGTGAYEEGRGYQNVPAMEVLAAFGYQEITVADLSEEELESIRELIRDSQQPLYGVDRSAITSGLQIYKNHRMARKGDSLIFFSDLGSLKSSGYVGWSRLRMRKGHVSIHPMNHDNSTFEMINLLSIHEAAEALVKKKRSEIENAVTND